MPAEGASLRALNRDTPNYPGRRAPQSVPFSGRPGAGYRQPPKVRPRLTKLQKKALKWARKHPEDPNAIRISGGTAITTNNAAITLDEVLYGFVGEPANLETYARLNRAIYTFANHVTNANLYATPTANYTPTTAATDTTGVTLFYTGDHVAGTFTITTNATSNITVTVPMSWTAWNAECTATGWADPAAQCHRPTGEWVRWQGQGHQADLYYDPNDQVQRARIRRERQALQDAQYQQQRMERAGREAEQQRQWEAGAPERERLRLEQETQHAQAKVRAYELLHQHLTDEQKTMLDNEHRFLVAARSGRIYEIRRGMHQNVYRLDDRGRAVEQLCCLPSGGVPEGDVMLAQMLHLMVNEERFRATANRWELHDMSPEDRRLPMMGRVAPARENRIMLPANDQRRAA